MAGGPQATHPPLLPVSNPSESCYVVEVRTWVQCNNASALRPSNAVWKHKRIGVLSFLGT